MIMILKTAIKIAVQSRRLFSPCRIETLSDPATIVTDKYGVTFVVCVGMEVLTSATNRDTILSLTQKGGEVFAKMESGLEIPANDIFQPHHTWIDI